VGLPLGHHVQRHTDLRSKRCALSPSAQIFARELSKRIDNYPTACGGGVFGFAGAQGKKNSENGANGFAGGIVEYDSNNGWSGGGLFEAGKTGRGGGGIIAGPSGAQVIVYAPVFEAGMAEGGLVGFSSGVGVYGEVGHGPLAAGAGAYLTVTSNAGCANLKSH